ncbi:hypothetical protein ASD02_23145 [Ensifer sp. Root1252]|nr:hypothetical protein ASD02_23145 [Ensifer sp. Root1252]KRC77939.1 hypothetical protein ASE32_27755 [Ensifer sp. Root231]KRD00359.1 hypothetical protein ASE47_23715 [Ensifer sp. Root258]
MRLCNFCPISYLKLSAFECLRAIDTFAMVFLFFSSASIVLISVSEFYIFPSLAQKPEQLIKCPLEPLKVLIFCCFVNLALLLMERQKYSNERQSRKQGVQAAESVSPLSHTIWRPLQAEKRENCRS